MPDRKEVLKRETGKGREGNLKLSGVPQRPTPGFMLLQNDATGSAAAPCEHPLLKD
jgi:hypothetical protein